ncbi:hypothetical protein RAH32_20640 [Paracoccus sp. WLY502]|uniref:hypothetical protein n=1 Tax=Paracoccus yibinensis TaxID=3068891 RepID=UPI002796A159|nr:hypothetical protein [Paracoccus sp. WLY502]MDQ1902827.1 hypothetical protein [Paracoccus sp. WLY502]
MIKVTYLISSMLLLPLSISPLHAERVSEAGVVSEEYYDETIYELMRLYSSESDESTLEAGKIDWARNACKLVRDRSAIEKENGNTPHTTLADIPICNEVIAKRFADEFPEIR